MNSTTSLLNRSNRPLQIFRAALLFLGTVMLILDIMFTARIENVLKQIDDFSSAGVLTNRGVYVPSILPDLFAIFLYSTLLYVVYRRNRTTAVEPTSSMAEAAPPKVLCTNWCALRTIFTLFLVGFMLFKPFQDIDKIRSEMAREESFYMGARPVASFNSSIRSILAIMTGFLILAEYIWSVIATKNANKSRVPPTTAGNGEKC
ncbi:hypothetical protein EMPS_04191 [Entomortierella parvispora]|uniref:Uncharacterized protein n=1 Tax=Entomortierella parvispora TaxID=205924 RepID=A0A9P3H811_9FUNG|nr:hypothetical protein EMPS_04191 [Entomortierella parvispora]